MTNHEAPAAPDRHDAVVERYSGLARIAVAGGTATDACGPEGSGCSGASRYDDADLAGVPDAAVPANVGEAGLGNVEILAGRIEVLPLPDAAVDVVISNCVVTLSADKAAVFAEAHRVLRPGGRLGLTDLVTDGDGADAAPGPVAGALGGGHARPVTPDRYRRLLADAGFTDIDVTPTHRVETGIRSAVVRAARPADVEA
jgi:SAM-dependent methyltransferase